MKQYSTLILALLLTTFCYAQHSTCDGSRYLTQTFEDFEVTTDVKFGENTSFLGNFQELKMDIYEPTGDEAEQRPAIVFAFGGAFVTGNRQTMVFLCEEYSRRGFVAATIDYRLLDGISLDSSLVYDAVVKAVGDMRAAVRYLREDAATNNQFRIDTTQIFAGGISAGALAAAHLAYLDESDDYIPLIADILEQNGGFEGNSSDNYEYSSEVQGVINFSGALKDAQWIDESDPPCFSVHDDGDMVVPYGKGFSSAFPFGNYLEGSAEMTARLEELGILNELITIENSDGHVSFFNPSSPTFSFAGQAIQGAADFMHQILCESTVNTKDLVLKDVVKLFPNPTTGFVELQLATDLANCEIVVSDYAGRFIQRVRNAQHLELSHLPKGFYQVAVRDLGGELLASQKLVLH